MVKSRTRRLWGCSKVPQRGIISRELLHVESITSRKVPWTHTPKHSHPARTFLRRQEAYRTATPPQGDPFETPHWWQFPTTPSTGGGEERPEGGGETRQEYIEVERKNDAKETEEGGGNVLSRRISSPPKPFRPHAFSRKYTYIYTYISQSSLLHG